jgi:hypothetical protein
MNDKQCSRRRHEEWSKREERKIKQENEKWEEELRQQWTMRDGKGKANEKLRR